MSSELLTGFTRILRDLLGDETISLSMETMRSDIPGWDSFQYINFIVAVEIQHGIKFPIADVEAFMTVGDIVAKTRLLLERR